MMRQSLVLKIFAIVLLFPAISKASDGNSTAILAVGEDRSFDPTLKKLQFAALDSKRFARAMELVSEVPAEQIHIVNNVSVDEFRSATGVLLRQLRKTPSIKRFVFYFSGHSDERGLHFRDGIFSKEELHAMLKKVSTQTKISILDSCYSGALAAKGIEPAVGEFTIPKSDYDEPTGTVFLTASSADEGAFESPKFESSVFSNYLVSGLYGNADSNNDGLVTVDELYQYIYQKTRYDNLMLPQSVQQQPEFVSKLQGRGALVLSMPKSNLQSLVIDPRIQGDIHVQATYGLRSYLIAAHLRDANPVRLPAGEYNFSVQNGDQVGRTSFKLQPHRIASVNYNDLEWSRVSASESRPKGPERPTSLPPPILSGVETAMTSSTRPVSNAVGATLSATPERRSKYSAFITMGVHTGYFEHQNAGPAVSIFAVHSAIGKLADFDVEPLIGFFGRQNTLSANYVKGSERAYTGLVGSRFVKSSAGSTQSYGLLAAGAASVNQQWSDYNGNRLDAQGMTPVLQIGVGFLSRLTIAGTRIGAEYRHESAFISDKNFGNATVGAHIVSLSMMY